MSIKGKLIHCDGIVKCEEPREIGYKEENGVDIDSFRNIFLKDFKLGYILELAIRYNLHFHIATHSIKTSTCQEKADITPANIAYLTDRIRVNQGQSQLYGTQFYRNPQTGQLEARPIETPEELDSRRAEMGLELFSDYEKGMIRQ